MKKVTLTLGMLTALASTHALAVDQITAVHAFPPSLIYTQSFLEFVDKVNERGEGVVQINVRGGPEVIGLFRATRRGAQRRGGHGLHRRQLLCRHGA